VEDGTVAIRYYIRDSKCWQSPFHPNPSAKRVSRELLEKEPHRNLVVFPPAVHTTPRKDAVAQFPHDTGIFPLIQQHTSTMRKALEGAS
jgi:hypothetical protein